MFHSATLKLTGWYLTTLIIISLLFSVIIYSVASREVGTHLINVPSDPRIVRIFDYDQFDTLRHAQVDEARHNLMASLVVSNLVIWALGGIGSYYLARRSLRPIEAAMDAQARFTSDASHELRTPLASMRTEIEVALRDPNLTPAEMREQLESNLEEVNKLTSLSHNLLKMSRLEHGSIAHEPVDLGAALSVAVGRFSQAKRRIKLPKSMPHTIVMCNQANLEELLTIFIDNAIKYSPPKSPIRVEYYHEKPIAGFIISNEGEGIDAESLLHIFDRFYQVDSSRTSGENKGYGLGLSLAKKLVELHNGELFVTSVPHGTTSVRIGMRYVGK